MKIYADDQKSWFSVEPWIDEETQYRAFTLEALIDIGHGSFQAKNIDVHLFNTSDFNAELDRFVTERTLIPRLDGTYDSFLEFHGDTSHVFVRFKIGDAFCGKLTQDISLSGGFEIEQQQLGCITTESRKLNVDS